MAARMNRFTKIVLNPIVGRLMAKVDAALEAPDVPGRIDGLLEARDESAAAFSGIRSDGATVAGAVGGMMCCGVVLIGGAAILAATGFGGLLLLATGSALCSGACLLARRIRQNLASTAADQGIIEGKIGRELASLAQAYPDEVIKTQRWQQILKNVFGPAASGDQDYAQLGQLVGATTRPKTPVPAI
jgi:hypothetical protein